MALEFKSELKKTLNFFLSMLLPSIYLLNLHLLSLYLRFSSKFEEYTVELGHSLQYKRMI